MLRGIPQYISSTPTACHPLPSPYTAQHTATWLPLHPPGPFSRRYCTVCVCHGGAYPRAATCLPAAHSFSLLSTFCLPPRSSTFSNYNAFGLVGWDDTTLVWPSRGGTMLNPFRGLQLLRTFSGFLALTLPSNSRRVRCCNVRASPCAIHTDVKT